MPCLPGLTPVEKVDHATGEIGGQVLPSGEKLPCPASALKLGSRPASISRRARRGSMPSSPITTQRRKRPCGPRRKSAASSRNGRLSRISMPSSNAPKKIRNDPITAKPAPGPM